MKILVCAPCFECIAVNVVMSSWGSQQTGNGWKRIHVHASAVEGVKGLVKRPWNVLASLPILFFVGICKDVWWILEWFSVSSLHRTTKQVPFIYYFYALCHFGCAISLVISMFLIIFPLKWRTASQSRKIRDYKIQKDGPSAK